jgi:Na+/proline symporter
LAVGLIPIFVGFAAKIRLADHITEDDVQGDQVLPIAASHFLSEPFEIVLLLGLISVNLAVAASATISQTTILSNNVLRRWLRHESGNPIRERACVIAVMIGSLVAAFSGESVMGLLEISLVIVMVALFVPMCVCLFARTVVPWTGVASMLAGSLVWGCHVAVQEWLPQDLASSGTSIGMSALQRYLAVPAEIQGLLASLIVATIPLLGYSPGKENNA